MHSLKRIGTVFLLLVAATALADAQEMNPTATPPPSAQAPQGPSEFREGVPVYKIQVVARDIPAINYFHRHGSTKIGFRGNFPAAAARRMMRKWKPRRDARRSTCTLEGLSPANGFGPEYLTYVLWAISRPKAAPSTWAKCCPPVPKNKRHNGNDQPAGFRPDRYSRTLLCSDDAQRPGGDAECRRRQDPGRDRAGECALHACCRAGPMQKQPDAIRCCIRSRAMNARRWSCTKPRMPYISRMPAGAEQVRSRHHGTLRKPLCRTRRHGQA